MRELSDTMKLVILISCVIIFFAVVIFSIVSGIEVSNRSQIREWRSDGATIIVNDVTINPQDIQRYSAENGVMALTLKNGQCIESTNWTVITPPPQIPLPTTTEK